MSEPKSAPSPAPSLFPPEYLAALNASRAVEITPRGLMPRLSVEERLALFAAEYVVDLNGKQAAIRAGYSPHTAESQASRLLRNVKVQAAIKAASAERLRKVNLSAEEVLAQLANILRFDIRDLYDEGGNLKPIDAWPEGAARVVEGIDSEEIYVRGKFGRELVGRARKIKIPARLDALRLAMQHLSLIGGNAVGARLDEVTETVPRVALADLSDDAVTARALEIARKALPVPVDDAA